MQANALDVHVVNTFWDYFWPGVIGVVGAVIGGIIGAGGTLLVARNEREDANRQNRQELLSRAYPALLDALVMQSIQVVGILREGKDEFVHQATARRAAMRMQEVQMAVLRDFSEGIPFVLDGELRSRLFTATQVISECRKLVSDWEVDTDKALDRAVVEVPAYLKWLRWNLQRAMNNEPLPGKLGPPILDRPLTDPQWLLPNDVPSEL